MDKDLEDIKKCVETISDLESQIILLEEKKKEIEERAIVKSNDFIINCYRLGKDRISFKYCFTINTEVAADFSISIVANNQSMPIVLNDISFNSIVPFASFKRLLSDSNELSTSTEYINNKCNLTKEDLSSFLTKCKESFITNFSAILKENNLEFLIKNESERQAVIGYFMEYHKNIESVLDINNPSFSKILSSIPQVSSRKIDLLSNYLKEKSTIYLKNSLVDSLNEERAEVRPKMKI